MKCGIIAFVLSTYAIIGTQAVSLKSNGATSPSVDCTAIPIPECTPATVDINTGEDFIVSTSQTDVINTQNVTSTFTPYQAEVTASAEKSFEETERGTGYGCGCRTRTTILNGNLCYQQSWEQTESGNANENEVKCRTQEIETTQNVYAVAAPEVNVQFTGGKLSVTGPQA